MCFTWPSDQLESVGSLGLVTDVSFILPSLPVGCMFPFGSGASIGPPGSSLVPTNSGNIGSTSCAIKPILVLVIILYL